MDNLETLSIPAEVLNLSDIKLVSTRLTSSNKLIIAGESTKSEILCHKYGELCVAHGKGTKIKLRHLPLCRRETYIELTTPRGICKSCDKSPTTTQTLSWHKINGRHTNAYEQQLLLSLVNSTISSVSIKEVISSSIPIVVGRFHVVKLYRKSLASSRKQEVKRLCKELTIEEYALLKNAISILAKKQEPYSKKDKLEFELLFKYSPAIKSFCGLAKQFTGIYNKQHRKKTAQAKIIKWFESIRTQKIDCFANFVGTLTKHKDYITIYFMGRNTSGFVESLNNKIKVIKRWCYGIIKRKHYFQRIFLDLDGYLIFLNTQWVTA